jgi:hypothetical protein
MLESLILKQILARNCILCFALSRRHTPNSAVMPPTQGVAVQLSLASAAIDCTEAARRLIYHQNDQIFCVKAGCSTHTKTDLTDSYCRERQLTCNDCINLHLLMKSDSCHFCHNSPSIVQFQNEQGLCATCKFNTTNTHGFYQLMLGI